MGSRRISEKYKKYAIRTDKDGLMKLFQIMRDLDSNHRTAYINELTKYSRDEIERLEKRLKSDSEYDVKYATEALPGARERHDQRLDELERDTLARVVMDSSRNRSEDYSGTIEEIVTENDISRFTSVKFYPSGRDVREGITVEIRRMSGISVELDTSDSEVYANASIRIPAELKRVSSRSHWLCAPAVSWILYVVAWISTMLFIGFDSGLPAKGWAGLVALAAVAIVVLRIFLFPNVSISDEPTVRNRIVSKIWYAIGAVALGMFGNYLYGLIV